MILRALIFTVGLALSLAVQAYAQLVTPTPSPLPSPTASSSPVPTATATATATPVETPSPAATPPSPYKYILEPVPSPSVAPDVPQIIRIELNDQTLHAGGQLAVRITTSPNVKRVVASTEGQNLEIVKAQDGVFAGMATLPGFIPPWFFKTYQVTVTASTDSKRATYTFPLTIAH